jgi:hypothetical protein
MKIDKHVLFLIVVVGVISAGLVGATVMNNDVSMKQVAFDGIKVSVPADSDFVKTGDGVYKDSKYGITINTFKNNNSMVNFLKNSKKSKIIPLENQPPQSIAFKKGNTINLLVTNGVEGMSVSSKDGELTSKVANSIVFSNNQKSQKSGGLSIGGLNIIKPELSMETDFNFISVILAQVNTNEFNMPVFQNNTVSVIEAQNIEIQEEPTFNIVPFDNGNGVDENVNFDNNVDDSNVTSVVSGDGSQDSNNDSDNELVEAFSNTVDTSAQDNSANNNPTDSNPTQASSSNNNPASSSSPSSSSNPSSPASSSSSSSSSPASSSSSNSQPSQSNNQPQKLSMSECKQAVSSALPNGYSIDSSDDLGDSYRFNIVDKDNKNAGYVVVDAKTGQITENHIS